MTRTPWTLGLGLLILLAFAGLGVAGPTLAPHDPNTYNYVTQINGAYVRPPFPAFATSTFVLGSDQFGRDTLSRLLWAVRPTLLLVGAITAARLGLGLLIGVWAGWWANRWGDYAIKLAALLPVLLIALAALAAFSQSLGGAAFFIGLAGTGWSDSAQLLREQIRLLRHQAFIEAARAAGLGTRGILLRHVLRQLMPTLQVLLPVETASVLLSMAALAVLGYFVGGDNWIMVGDFTAARTSGSPELGQMLALAINQRNTDSGLWQMVVTGALVVLLSIGLNLTSEGLNQQQAQTLRKRQLRLTLGDLLETRLIEQEHAQRRDPQRSVRRRRWVGLGIATVLAGGLAAFWLWPRPMPVPVVAIPGHHLWASAKRDGVASLRAASTLSTQPTITWQLAADENLVGGPVLAQDGTLYINAERHLIGVGQSRASHWSVPLQATPIGSPALDAQGNVYVVDVQGGLSAFAPDGQPRWRYTPAAPQVALDGPVVGPTGDIYYPVEGYVIAIKPDGSLKWRGDTSYSYFSVALRVNHTYVFFQDMALSAVTGKKILKESVNPIDQFVTGSDGQLYLQSDRGLLQWVENEGSIALAQAASWDYTRFFPGVGASQAGVALNGSAWLLFSNPFQDGRIAWMDSEGKLIASFAFPLRDAHVIAISEDDTLLICGQRGSRGSACVAAPLLAGQPVWQFNLPGSGVPVGGALVEGQLYLATSSGQLFALGAN